MNYSKIIVDTYIKGVYIEFESKYPTKNQGFSMFKDFIKRKIEMLIGWYEAGYITYRELVCLLEAF